MLKFEIKMSEETFAKIKRCMVNDGMDRISTKVEILKEVFQFPYSMGDFLDVRHKVKITELGGK